MGLILIWGVIGVVGSLALTSFLSGAGTSGSMIVNLIAGLVGGFVGGYAFMFVGPFVVGPGPAFLFSFLGAAVGAVIAVLIASKVMK